MLAQCHDGSTVALTWPEVFEHAGDLRRLAAEPSATVALVRLLATSMHHTSTEPLDLNTWTRCWQERRLPVGPADLLPLHHQARLVGLTGPASVGHLDGILIEGEDVLQTLLLNLLPHDEGVMALDDIDHRPERRLWRGITALLASTDDRPEPSTPPVTLQWLARVSDRMLAPDIVTEVRAIRPGRAPRTSMIGERVALPARLLRWEHHALRRTVLRAIDDVDLAVLAYAQLRDDLDRSAGGRGGAGIRAAARAEAFDLLDPHFRRWMLRFAEPGVSAVDSCTAWSTTARQLLLAAAQHALDEAGAATRRGQGLGMPRLDRSTLEPRFVRTLFLIFPVS